MIRQNLYKILEKTVVILVIIGIIFWVGRFLPTRAATVSLYSSHCLGEWFGTDRVLGEPQVSSNGSFNEFNESNSAVYQSGYQSIICDGFLQSEGKFISAKLGLSLAIGENTREINNIQVETNTQDIKIEGNIPSDLVSEPEINDTDKKNNLVNDPESSLAPLGIDSAESAPEPITPINNTPTEYFEPEINNQENSISPGKDQNNDVPADLNLESLFKINLALAKEKNEITQQESSSTVPYEELNLESEPPSLNSQNTTTTTEILNLDNILNIRYHLGDQNYLVNTFSSYPISPAINNGYFYFDLPEVKSFDDLEKLKISLEGLLGGDPRLTSYLDSLWVEVVYEDVPTEIVSPTLVMDKNSWRSDEEPVIQIKTKDNNLIKKDDFKKSIIKKLDILSAEPQIEMSLIDSTNKEISLELDKDFQVEDKNGVSQIKLLQSRSFKPGHYKLKYKIEQNGKSAEAEYEFQWGVLAINTNKSVYLPNEQAYLQMAVLSDSGRTICNANLKLEIISPQSEIINLSTKEGTIKYSDSCGANNVTDNPDYFAYYQTSSSGLYQLKLTNLDNNYEINDSFEVNESLPFEIERISATRINPFESNYVMTIKIKANQDFEGKISEPVPAEFEITPADEIKTEKTNGAIEISWQEKIKIGEEIILRYQYAAPKISPQLYLTGPLKIIENENIIFEEKRQWQLAADVTNLLLFWAGAGGSCSDAGAPPTGWELVSDGSFTGIFPRGNTVYKANNGLMGSANHAHQSTISNSASTDTTAAGNVGPPIALVGAAHTHGNPTALSSTSSSLPLYKDLCVIKLSTGGIPSGSSAIPENAIAIIDTSAPSGWADYSATFGTYYIRGNTTPGGTGGSNTHANPGHVVAGALDEVAPSLSATVGTTPASGRHSHNFSLTSTDTPKIEPLSQEVILIQKTTSAGPIPVDMIAMFDGDPGNGWNIKSGTGGDFETKYIKVTGTYQNNLSGATTHAHQQMMGNSDPDSAGVSTGAIPTGSTITRHSHKITIDLATGTNTNLPPYSDVVIAQKLNFTISGTSDVEGGTVKVAYDNVMQDDSAVVGTGSWTINTTTFPASNQIITVWVDGAAEADESTAVTKYDGSGDSTGMVLNRHVLSLGSADNPSLTVTNLNQYDNDDDEDIMYSANSGGVTGALKVDEDNSYTDEKLDILANATLTISTGESLTTHDLAINGSLTSSGSGTFNIGGFWDNNNDFNSSAETINFTSTTTETIDSTGASDADVNKIVLNGSGGQWTASSALTINDDLTVTAGTLAGTVNVNINGGDVTGDGDINLTGGVFTLDGAGNFGGATSWDFNSLTFGDGTGSTTTTATGNGSITVTKGLTIAANQTLDAGSKTWTLSGTGGTVFTKPTTANFTANASTFKYTGDNLSGDTTILATTYNHLTVDNASETYVLAGATSLNGDLNITNGTLDVVRDSNFDLNVKGSWINNGIFTAQVGRVTFNGTSSGKNINAGVSAFHDLTFNGSGGQWTLLTSKLTIDGDLNITTGTLIASSLDINLQESLNIGLNGIFTKGSGTFTFAQAGAITVNWTDNSTGGPQDLGTTMIDGTTKNVQLGSSVKCTKLTIGSDDTLDLGAASSYILTLTGSGEGASKPLTIVNGGNLTLGDSTISYTGGAATDVTTLIDATGGNYYNLTLNGVGPFTAETGSLTIDHDLNVTSGTFNLGGITIVNNDVSISGTLDVVLGANYGLRVGGSWTNTGGIFNAQQGLVTFQSVGVSVDTITTNSQPFYSLNFNNAVAHWDLQDILDVNNTFTLTAGRVDQAADPNINFGGSVNFEVGTTFTKASGSGLVIFDGSSLFTDETATKQNLGDVQVGTSPDDVTLCTDSKMDNLTVNLGDTFYSNQYDITITDSVTIHGTLDLATTSGLCAGSGAQTDLTLGSNWAVDNTGTFLAGGSLVKIDSDAVVARTLSSGGTDNNHDFNSLTIDASVVSLTDYNLHINSNLSIDAAGSFDASASNYNINVGGAWANNGIFTARAGTVTFDGTAGALNTIDSGGTGEGKTFYNIIFDGLDSYLIQTNNLTATNNFTLTTAVGFTLDSGLTLIVNGVFTNSVGGAATTWTGSIINLTRTSGSGSYSINNRTDNGDTYATLQIGANTDIRMWSSSASTLTVNATGSLYSMDHAGNDGQLYVWGDYHVTTGNTDYWNYNEDFDGTAGANRQVKVYLNTVDITSPSVTVDNGGTLNVKGNGSLSSDITIVGQDASAPWNFDCSGTCNVQESTWNYLNLSGGTLTLFNSTLNNEDAPDAGSTLNVDWYLGDLVVDLANPATPIDTGDSDITISENSGTPASTVFKWAGGNWGAAGATSQTTGTGADGKIPQPGTNGAIRLREYSRTSAGYTFYKYNLHIAWQGSSYGEYDYYNDYGDNYITSTLSTGSGEDECISELWQRNDMDAQNVSTQAINLPPSNGTWFNGMVSGLTFTVAGMGELISCTTTGGTLKTTTATTVPYETINPENFYDACQSLTVSTSASNGYTVTIQETDQMTEPANNNQIPDGNCDGGLVDPCNETTSSTWNTAANNGFAYCMDDANGDAAATAQPANWATAKQCGGAAQSFMIIPEKGVDVPDNNQIMQSAGPVSGDVSYIGFRLSADTLQEAGTYTTTIIYVITATY